MPKFYGDLQLVEKFPASATLKLAKHLFGNKPWTCNMIYDAHVKYYKKEQRNKNRIATSIAQLIRRGFLDRHPEKTADSLTQYVILDEKKVVKKGDQKIGYMDVFELIKEKFAGRSFTAQDCSDAFDHKPDLRFHVRTLEKKDMIVCLRRDFRGKHYKLADPKRVKADQPDQAYQARQPDPADQLAEHDQARQPDQADQAQQPIKIVHHQIIDKEILRTLDMPLELIGEAIVMKIAGLRRTIDDMQTIELQYKRQLDEMQKTAHAQSRIIESLNNKLSALNQEPRRKSPTKIANLGEIARISTLRNRK